MWIGCLSKWSCSRMSICEHLLNIRVRSRHLLSMDFRYSIEYNPPAFLKAPFGLKRYLGLRHTANETRSESSSNTQQPHILFASLRDAADQTEIVGNTELNVACRSFRGVNRASVIWPKDSASGHQLTFLNSTRSDHLRELCQYDLPQAT